jgi:hypothetical protein
VIFLTTDKHLVVSLRKPRSKWIHIWCSCAKRGRDKAGICKHQRELRSLASEKDQKRIILDPWKPRRD